ncbi:MAG: ABC transporter ATP-binding protein [Deltaproteobacteria bacterium]
MPGQSKCLAPNESRSLNLSGVIIRNTTDSYRAAVVPRLQIVRLLPSAGAGLVTMLALVNVIVGLLPVGFILATGALIGRVPAAVTGGYGSAAFGDLIAAFLLGAGAFLGQQMLTPLQGALGERMKRRVDGQLRDETLSIVMQGTGIAPMEDPQTLSALSEATRLFETAWNTPGMACSGLLALLARYVRLIGLLSIIGVVASWPAAFALGGATMLFRYGQRGGLRKYSVVWRELAGINRRSQYLRELAMGGTAAKEVRVFGLVDWVTRRYADSFFAIYHSLSTRRREFYLKPYLIYTPIGLVVGACVTVAIARSAAAGAISLTELALGVQAVTLALLLGEFYPEADVPTQYGMQAVAALEEVRGRVRGFDGSTQQQGLPVAASLPAPSVSLEDISFQYPGTPRTVLDRLDLQLPAGKCTAIVGVNGAGKTTLVKLLTRLYEPTAGSVRVNGTDIARLDPVAWRRQVSVIFQDFVRYELSAADNIALGAAHVPRDPSAVEQAAEQAGILEALSGLPLGLDTPLARAYAGGIELSGGQWQRIAIARSLYALRAGARVLILDEPTSALDVRAEAAFFDRFVELTAGVTSVLISHRFSSVRRADRIVVVDAGRVVEQGNHADLMAAGGYYARLFRLQAERFAADVDADGHRIESAGDPGPPVGMQPKGAVS